MTEQKSNVIEKIKKLFALGKSPNENESALALAKAHALMLQHGIEQNDLASNTINDIVEIDFALQSKFNSHVTTLAFHINNAFFVKSILINTKTGYHKVQKKVRFIGEKSDIAVATYIFSYVLNLAETKGQDYYKSIKGDKKWSPLSAKKVKTDFAFGFIASVCEKLKQIRADHDAKNKYAAETCNALMIVKNNLIEQYIKENIGKLHDGKASNTKLNANAYNAGKIAGKDCGIYRGVESGGNNQLMLGA